MYVFIIYDIPSQRRLKKAARFCEQNGLHRIQKSVFLGRLSPARVDAVKAEAKRLLSPDEDRFLLIPIRQDDLAASADLGLDCGIRELLERPNVIFA